MNSRTRKKLRPLLPSRHRPYLSIINFLKAITKSRNERLVTLMKQAIKNKLDGHNLK